MTVVVMGVSGCGKSSVGLELAQRLGWEFQDADDYHPRSNVEKMRQGNPLTDEDRAGWLDALAGLLTDRAHRGSSLVLACSALREAYRRRLTVNPWVHFVYLRGSRELIAARLRDRQGHFMNPGLLESQFRTLEEPVDAVVVDIELSVPNLVDQIVDKLKEFLKVERSTSQESFNTLRSNT